MSEIKGLELLNVKENLTEIRRIMKKHRIAIQKGIAIAMTNTRKRAGDYILPNTSGILNPYFARKKEPVVPGRLRSRTGKLKLMLYSRTSPSNPLRDWKGFGNKIAKQKSIALQSFVRVQVISKTVETYEGTIRVQILGGDQRLFDVSRGQPQESLRTLAVRFNWEVPGGIRGQRRPFFEPVTRQTEFDMTKYVEQKNAEIWRLH